MTDHRLFSTINFFVLDDIRVL